MMTTTQHEALAVLNDILTLAPDIRLGQLFTHLGLLSEDQTGRPLCHIDDDQLIAIMQSHRAELAARTADSSHQPAHS